ncbi:MAG: hypothetical protein JWQ89_3708 [Devosia sp.]|uniref:hypothetical protein n=1 Tax=Devosia sp. TaxID=1871048 RepID=UPI0026126BEB|nr:hypothetical protein [Devosia sp.]MDB5541981.1 hypothetical protein [Devosia sp.]
MTIQTIPAAGQFGFVADATPQELPPNAWSNAQNMRFRDGYAERFRGSSQIFTTPSVAPYYLTPYRSLNSKFWIHAGIARVYSDDGTTRTDLTPTTAYTGSVDDRWTGGSASGVLVINNGVDQPQFWGGDTAVKFANLTGWNSAWRAASMRPFKNYLVALDITKSGARYPHMVKWSSAADPGSLPPSWDETDATKDAGEQPISDTTDFLIDQLALGDINVIYKERSMFGMQYIGPPYIWRFYRLPGESGMLTRGCAVNTPKGHVVLTSGDLILHNGQGPQSIVSGRMRKWLFNSIDPTNYARSFLVTNPALNEVWVCFPTTGQAACTLALVWNWQDDTFGVRQLSNATYGGTGQINTSTSGTWASDTDTWDHDTTSWNSDGFGSTETRLLMTSTTPLISLMETGTQFNGVDPTCIIERIGLAFDAPDQIKTVTRVVPRIDAVPGTVLSIQVGASMDAEVGPLWSPAVAYTVGTSRKVDAFATGRFLAYRITSTSSQPWRFKSFDMGIVSAGAY